MQIYVGNLAYGVSENDLTEMFTKFGNVTTVNLIKDRTTGQSKGFGFVEMPKNSEADTAIKALNGTPLQGRPVKVNQSEPKKESSPRGGGNRRY